MNHEDFETADDIDEHIDWIRLSDNLPDEEPDEERDRAAEAWLTAQHDTDWYLGNATEDEWRRAYEASK